MPAFDVVECTIADLHAAYRAGQVTARAVTQAYLERIAAYDRRGPYLNSLITVNEHALTVADALDASLQATGDLSGPLHGVPVIFFGSGSPPEYHTPADEIGIVGFDKLEKITRHVALMTADVANDDTRPAFVADPQPQLDDARALIALGEVVLDDPSSLGIDDPVLVGILEGWLADLKQYLAHPPTTDQQWESYERFVKSIITTVYGFIGGADPSQGAAVRARSSLLCACA